MDREKASVAICPSCGSELGFVAQADGSVAQEPCGTCYGAKAPEPAPPAPPVNGPFSPLMGAGAPKGDDDDE